MNIVENRKVIELIERTQTCKFNYDENNNFINTSLVKDILENKFINDIEMDAVICVFRDLIEKSKIKDSKKEPYPLDSEAGNWITNMEVIQKNSSRGIAFITSVLNDLDLKVIFKVSRKGRKTSDFKLNETDLYREYAIGVNAINKLRQYVPSFACVLGIFKCLPTDKTIKNVSSICSNSTDDSKRTPYVIYEYIEGLSMKETISSIQNSTERQFGKILEIFVQILIALEIAQQQYNFTHHDLHVSNVIIKISRNPITYNVIINNNYYTVNTNILPVIIDYGMSSVRIEGYVYGSNDFYGTKHNGCAGFDMYMFLVSILTFLARKNPNLNSNYNEVKRLFSFYGTDDVYDVVRKGPTDASTDYCVKVLTSNLAKYTPKMFLDWIFSDPYGTYRMLLDNSIVKNEREIYRCVNPSILSISYEDIYNRHTNNVADIVIACSELSPSYLINNYTIHILNKYVNESKSDSEKRELIERIEFIRSVSEDDERKRKMIEYDMKILEGTKYIELMYAFSIKHDIYKNEIDALERFLLSGQNISVNDIKSYAEPQISYFIRLIKRIDVYLDFMYMILEVKNSFLGNTSKYDNWIKNFRKEKAFKFYIDNIKIINRCSRIYWKYL